MKEIIDFLRENHFSTAAISDALGKKGTIPAIVPMCQPTLYAAGKIRFLCAIDNSNWHLHYDAQFIEPGEVVYIKCDNCGDFAAMGELVTRYCIEKKKASAVVINGLIRDVGGVRHLPVWAKGFTPLGCYNGKSEREPDKADIHGVMACDDSGVVVIPTEELTKQTLAALHKICDREKRWFAALEKGLSTFEIVCEGKY